MIWYCDSSALVKRYVREIGSQWLRQQLTQAEIHTSVLTLAEISSALARRRRDGTLSAFEFHRSRTHFSRHLQTGQYTLYPATLAVIESAALSIYQLPLAAYDAVHLASARHALSAGSVPPGRAYLFVTADEQLRRAATAEGFLTENPNEHP